MRPLSARGERRTRRAAEGLARVIRQAGPGGVAIWTSPLVRAEQTARRLAAALPARERPDPLVVTALAPGGSTRSLIERLAAASAEPGGGELAVVLVGHEPDLGVLAGELALEPPLALPLRKAGACAVAFDGAPRRRGGTLEWLLPPRLLRVLAGKGARGAARRAEVS